MQNKYFSQKFYQHFAVQLCKYLRTKKLSAKPNSFWKLGSRDPTVFPALVSQDRVNTPMIVNTDIALFIPSTPKIFTCLLVQT